MMFISFISLVIRVVIALVLAYLIIAFVLTEFNIFLWGRGDRGMMVLAAMLICFITLPMRVE